MRDVSHYRGSAAIQVTEAQTVAVVVDLYWGRTPSWRDREGRLSGTLQPAAGGGALSPPSGDVMLRLPDGYEAAGRLTVVAPSDGRPAWCAFAGPAPCFPAAKSGLDGHCLVVHNPTIGLHRGKEHAREVLDGAAARLGVRTRRSGSHWFCADLTDPQLDGLRWELGIGYVEQEREGHPAPLFRARPDHAIDGNYLVQVRDGVDPRTVAARLGVEPHSTIAPAAKWFGADLNRVELKRVRHDPDVIEVGQNQRFVVSD